MAEVVMPGASPGSHSCMLVLIGQQTLGKAQPTTVPGKRFCHSRAQHLDPLSH